MARAKTPKPSDPSGSMALAIRLRDALRDDPEFALDDVPQETGVVIEPGAMFHVTDVEGRVLRVRINRHR